jgi:hypothetical protein
VTSGKEGSSSASTPRRPDDGNEDPAKAVEISIAVADHGHGSDEPDLPDLRRRKPGKPEWTGNVSGGIIYEQGPILQNFASAGNFPDKFSSSNFGQIFTLKRQTCIYVINLGFYGILMAYL